MNTKRGLESRFLIFKPVKELMLKLFCRIRQNKADEEPSLFYRSSPMERKI